MPIPLAPKLDPQPRKCLNPKKLKLSILTIGCDKKKNRGKDLSDVEPVLLASTDSWASSGSSTMLVRWDEQGLETVREQRKKEREVKEAD